MQCDERLPPISALFSSFKLTYNFYLFKEANLHKRPSLSLPTKEIIKILRFSRKETIDSRWFIIYRSQTDFRCIFQICNVYLTFLTESEQQIILTSVPSNGAFKSAVRLAFVINFARYIYALLAYPLNASCPFSSRPWRPRGSPIHWSGDPGAGGTLGFPRLPLSPPLWRLSGSHTRQTCRSWNAWPKTEHGRVLRQKTLFGAWIYFLFWSGFRKLRWFWLRGVLESCSAGKQLTSLTQQSCKSSLP